MGGLLTAPLPYGKLNTSIMGKGVRIAGIIAVVWGLLVRYRF